MLVETLVTGFVVGFVALVAYGHVLLLQAALYRPTRRDSLSHSAGYGPAAVTPHAIRR
jgi:hypothetical protein